MLRLPEEETDQLEVEATVEELLLQRRSALYVACYRTLKWLKEPTTLLYFSHSLSSFGNKVWGFAMPMLFAAIYPESLMPASLFAFCVRCVCIIGAPQLGKIVDSKPRKQVIVSSLVVQNSMLLASSLSILLLYFTTLSDSNTAPIAIGERHFPIDGMDLTAALRSPIMSNDSSSDGQYTSPFASSLSTLMFVLAIIAGSISELASSTTELSITKDWAVVISNKDPAKLTQLNSVLRRIALTVDIISPLAFTALTLVPSGGDSVLVGLVAIAVWNVGSFVPELLLLLRIYKLTPQLAIPKTAPEMRLEAEAAAEAAITEATSDDIALLVASHEPDASLSLRAIRKLKQVLMALVSPIYTIVHGWRRYAMQDVVLASVAYALLYCTVLSPGTLLTAYLRLHGIPDSAISGWRAISSLIGVAATFIAPRIIRRMGTVKGGTAGLWLQTSALAVGVVLFFLPPAATLRVPISVYGFMASVSVSRIGLWVFDIAETQLMQLHVADSERAAVCSVELALTNLAFVASLLLGVVVSDPKRFGILVVVSAACVLAAAVIYSVWARFGPGARIAAATTSATAVVVDDVDETEEPMGDNQNRSGESETAQEEGIAAAVDVEQQLTAVDVTEGLSDK